MADYEIIAEGTLTSTATSIDITSIPATSTHLELFINARTTKAAATIAYGSLRVNGIAGGTSYGLIGLYTRNNVTASVYNLTGSNGNYTSSNIDSSHTMMDDGMPANAYSANKIVIPNYANTTTTSKGFLISNHTPSSNTSVYWQIMSYGFVVSSAAINRIELFVEPGGSPFKAGTSYLLAGWK